jgi:hypothetical protein
VEVRGVLHLLFECLSLNQPMLRPAGLSYYFAVESDAFHIRI